MSRPLHVAVSLHTHAPEQRTGTWTYASGLMPELARRAGVRVTAVGGAGSRASVAELPGVSFATDAHVPAGQSAAARRARVLAMGTRAGAIRHRTSVPADADVVLYPLSLALPRLGPPSVVALHDVQHRDLPELFSAPERAWRRLTYELPAARSALVVVGSHHARERLVDAAGLDPRRVAVAPYGVDLERFSPDPEPGEDAVVAGLGIDEPFAYYPASLWAHKNHELLVDALAELGADAPLLVLSGSTFDRLDALLERARARGVEDRILHVGLVPVATVAALYRAARAVVVPSRYEGFGWPPLEAMACGTPVASSRAASLRELCEDASLPIDPDDAGSAADAIRRLFTDEALRADLIRRGHENVGRFTWEACADRHLELFAAVRDGHGVAA
jgi:glycosyltransferase involved in cell wall biosynthesis